MPHHILFITELPDGTLRSVTRELSSFGYRVSIARRASEAIALVRGTGFDAAVVDGLLPDGNGLDIAERLRHSGFDGPTLLASPLFADAASIRRASGIQLRRIADPRAGAGPFALDLHRVLSALAGGRATG